MDKMLIAYGPLADISDAPWGVFETVDGQIRLDETKTFNRARIMLDAGANTIRILRRGVWEITTAFDWEHPDYFRLLRKYLAITHQPFQGDNAPRGADIVIDIFDGCSEDWQYDPANYGRARQLLRAMFTNLGDLPYVKFSVGNEMNHPGFKQLLKEVIIPEFISADIIPFMFGACYSIHDDILEETKQFHGIAWGDQVENMTYRPVHGVKDYMSRTLIDTVAFWTPANNPISIWWSVDGVWDGEGEDGENGNFRPSPAQIGGAMEYWMNRVQSFEMYGNHRKFAFEYLPKARNRDDLAAKGVQAISDSYFDWFGYYPENAGKYPLDWVEPVVPPTPEPVKPPFNFKGWWNNNHEIAIAVIAAIVILVGVLILR